MYQIRFWHSALPEPLAGYEKPTSKGRQGRKDGREWQGRGDWRGGEAGTERGVSPPNLKTKLRP